MNAINQNYITYKNTVRFSFESYIDDYINNAQDPKVFGKAVWPLIFCNSATPFIVDDILDTFNQRIVNPGLPYDKDDFHFHLSYLYLVMRQYVAALSEFEKIQAPNLAIELQKWKTYLALIAKSLGNYPPTNFMHPFVSYNPMQMDKTEIMMLFKWQDSVRYWNDIGVTETAYIECLNTLQYTSKVFEHKLSDLCRRKSLTPSRHDIDSMIIALQPSYLGMNTIKARMEAISKAKTPIELVSNLTNLEGFVANCPDLNERFGGLLFLCRVIRNNSSHEMALNNVLFSNANEFIHYVSILHEGILMVEHE